MPKFTWTKTDATLTKAVSQGGLGLTQIDVNSIVVQQQIDGYVFEWHTGYHGEAGGHYVYIRQNNDNSKNLPRAWISGPKAGTVTGEPASRVKRDVLAVVGNANNRTLLMTACTNANR